MAEQKKPASPTPIEDMSVEEIVEEANDIVNLIHSELSNMEDDIYSCPDQKDMSDNEFNEIKTKYLTNVGSLIESDCLNILKLNTRLKALTLVMSRLDVDIPWV